MTPLDKALIRQPNTGYKNESLPITVVSDRGYTAGETDFTTDLKVVQQ